MLCLSQRRDNVGGESGELLRSRPGEQSCATMLVSSPEGVNSELLEELMSSEGESLESPVMVWPSQAEDHAV